MPWPDDFAPWSKAAYPVAHKRVLQRFGNRDLAHDSVMDVLVAFREDPSKHFQNRNHFVGCVVTEAHHRALRILRRAGRERPLPDSTHEPSLPGSREFVPIVWECIQRLCEEDRQLVLWRYEGLRLHEIASRSQVKSPSTARKHLRGALAQLRDCVLNHGLDPITWEVLP